MRIPNKIKGSSKEKRVKYCIDRLKSRFHFHPGKRYNLLVRKPHQVPGEHQEYRKDPGTGLLKRNEHWEKFKPLKKIRLPEKENAVRSQTTINDLRTRKDFKKWFESQFPNLPDGVYGAVQRAGKGHGYNTLFLLEYGNGSIQKWQNKSRSQKGAGEGESANYFAFPWYFQIQDRYGVPK